jgi:hypothetical protein
MGGVGNGSDNVRIDPTLPIHSPPQSGRCSTVPTFYIASGAQNDRAIVGQCKELLPLVYKHQLGLFLHVGQKHPQSHQGLK